MAAGAGNGMFVSEDRLDSRLARVRERVEGEARSPRVLWLGTFAPPGLPRV